MTSTSIEIVFPINSMAREFKIPYGLKPCPSNSLKVVGDRLRSREPMLLQQDNDMTHVEDPSSIIV